MNITSCKTTAMIVIGLVGVNFFYISDLLFGKEAIILGPKAFAGIAAANILVLAGLYLGHCRSTK